MPLDGRVEARSPPGRQRCAPGCSERLVDQAFGSAPGSANPHSASGQAAVYAVASTDHPGTDHANPRDDAACEPGARYHVTRQ